MIDFMGRQNSPQTYTIPVFVRARDYHLYDQKGRRYIDFFQNHGRAILGHRPDGVFRAMKATASRGLIAEYPSFHQGRLEKILEQLLPGPFTVRYFSDLRYAREVLQQAFGTNDAPLVIADPALTTPSLGDKVSFWRPFLEDVELLSPVFIPILPFPGNFVPEIVCVRDETLAKELPPSDPVSPLLLDLLVKSASALLGTAGDTRKRESKRNPLSEVFPLTKGPYSVTGFSEERYREFYTAALELGVVLPPGPCFPLIFPQEYSEGEVGPLIRLARDFVLGS